MFAHMENDASSIESNAYIRNSSVVVELFLEVPKGSNMFYRGGVIGYTSDDDQSYDGISIYVSGSLDSLLEVAEFFGGLIGFNGANGVYKHIYIFADMEFFGMSTTAAGLIAVNGLSSSLTL